MKNLSFLIIVILVSCNPANKKYSVNDIVSIKNVKGKCNCTIHFAHDARPIVNLLCEDENGRFTKLEEININTIEKCECDSVKPVDIEL